MKLKNSAKAIIAILVLAIIALSGYVILRSKNNNSSGQPGIIQDNGDIEIQIPEDQETGGF